MRIVAGAHLVEPFREVLGDLPAAAYLVEPRARGTGPALAWAAWEVARTDPDAVLVSLHADHLIRPLTAFQDTVRAGAELARTRDVLVTVGVEPDRVETGFGHIRPGDPLTGHGTADGVEAFRVAAFHEKPDADTARSYMDAGYLWNSGIFIWRASVFLEEIRTHAPEVASRLPLLESAGPDAFFSDVPVCVVDRAVLERSERVACVKATFTWDDVGSWAALARTHQADDRGNVAVGDARVVDGGGNIVFSEGGRVVLFGVDDLVVARSGDVTLVLPRARAEDLKALLEEIGP